MPASKQLASSGPERAASALSDADAGMFHAGELAMQRDSGVAERMARLGPQMIRDHMSEQHRAFFPLLPWVVVGSMDERGQPQASLLTGPPGFISSPDAHTLRLDALPLPGDPLDRNLTPAAPLALLGLQPHARRRNRANGNVLERDERGASLLVRQSYGNCPKYIQAREVRYAGPSGPATLEVAERLSEPDRTLISGADTFFIASAHPGARQSSAGSHGLDVSHRGGPPGFVAFADPGTLVIPDFRGNDLYNTLGNLRVHAPAGLLFIDLVSGDLLQLEVVSTLAYGTHPLSAGVEVRLVRFQVQRARRFNAASQLVFAPLAAG